jgi:hypothetical protein
MADWTTCPHCQLKHSARPDGLCPRCRQSSGAASPGAPAVSPPPLPPPLPEPAPSAGATGTVYRGDPPSTAAGGFQPRPSSPRASDGLPLGARIAGAVLILNALALIWEAVTLPKNAGASPFGAGQPVSAVVDLALGGMLLAGRESVLRWTQLRVVLGGLLFAGVFLSQGQTVMAVFQVAFSAALLGLLVGRAEALRLGVSTAALGLYFVLEIVGLSGSSVLARSLLRARGDIGGEAVTRLEGDRVKYHLTLPGGSWYLRQTAAARKDNPLADRWLIRPANDAHIITIVEDLAPGQRVDLDRFAKVVLENRRTASTWLDPREQTPLAGATPGEFVHVVSLTQGVKVETYYGLFVAGRHAYQVVAFAQQDAFPGLAAELRQVIESFEPAND